MSETAIDAEFSAIQSIFSTLSPLDASARQRVLDYIIARLELPLADKAVRVIETPLREAMPSQDSVVGSGQSFDSLAELHDAAQPKTNAHKALVAGYWLQVCQENDTFDSQSANTALKHLGDGLANITAAIDSLKNQKPALALQLRKSGKTQQARKVYKITTAGIKEVENMINS